MTAEKKAALKAALARSGLPFAEDASLAPLLSIKAGGAAWALLTARGEDELRLALSAAAEAGCEVLVVGGGANLWVRDGGFPGLALQLGEGFARLESAGERWYAGAALPLQRLVERATREARERFLFLGGIPGTVGGAVSMNAGTDKGEMVSVVEAVDALLASGERARLSRAEMGFRYRGSDLPPGAVVVGALLDPGPVAADPEGFRALMRSRAEKRRKTQPVQLPTSGSTFKNPPGDYAGRLIEAAGLKGERLGGAEISAVHANFIVNPERRAKTADLVALVELAKRTVREKFAIELELEVRVVGEESGR
jgi:UDP-N-acetylmuramate dehydrogenase